MGSVHHSILEEFALLGFRCSESYVRVRRQFSVAFVASCHTGIGTRRTGRRFFHHCLRCDNGRRCANAGRIGSWLCFVGELEPSTTGTERGAGTEAIIRCSGIRWRGYFSRGLRRSELLAGVSDHHSIITVTTGVIATGSAVTVFGAGAGSNATTIVVAGLVSGSATCGQMGL